MQTVRVSERSGRDGVLHLRVPVGEPEAEYEAVIVLQPKTTLHAPGTAEGPGWPARYFEETFGCITDETFTRPPQDELPAAVDFG